MVIIISPAPPEAKGDDDSAIWCVTSSTNWRRPYFCYVFLLHVRKNVAYISNSYRIESEKRFFFLFLFIIYIFNIVHASFYRNVIEWTAVKN